MHHRIDPVKKIGFEPVQFIFPVAEVIGIVIETKWIVVLHIK